MGKIRFWINRYFGFSRSETNGFFLLLLLTLLAAMAPWLLYTASPPEDLSRDQADLDRLVARLEAGAQRQAAARKLLASRPGKRRQALKKFDPNVLSREEWLAMGLNTYTASNILKYKERAGSFRYKEQIERIYGMSPALYRELAPFIDLPSRRQARAYVSARRPERRPFPVNKGPAARAKLAAFDINTADTLQLMKINGIGPALSGRIVRFRDKLGGFAQKHQLGEVYGLSPEVVDSLHKYVFIREGFKPRQIALNTASLQQLQAHPYLGYRTARLILAYRTQHGPFQKVEELNKIRQISESQLEKIRPYLLL
jgi:competence protein ComEA